MLYILVFIQILVLKNDSFATRNFLCNPPKHPSQISLPQSKLPS